MELELMDTDDHEGQPQDADDVSRASWGKQLPRIALGDGCYLTVPAPRDE